MSKVHSSKASAARPSLKDSALSGSFPQTNRDACVRGPHLQPRQRLLPALVMAALTGTAAQQALANPVGANVVAGSAGFAQAGLHDLVVGVGGVASGDAGAGGGDVGGVAVAGAFPVHGIACVEVGGVAGPGPLAAVGERPGPHGDVGARAPGAHGAGHGAGVLEGFEVQAQDQALAVFAPAGQEPVVAQAVDVALAGEGQGPGHGLGGAGVDVGFGVDEVDGVAQPVQGQPVPQAVDADLGGFFGGGDVVEACDVVAVEEVGVDQAHPEAVLAGGVVAGVVQGGVELQGPAVGDVDVGVNQALALGALEDDVDLLGGVFVGELDVGRQGGGVGEGPFLQGGQAPADVLFAEGAVALHAHAPDGGFDHLQGDHAAAELLFGDVDLHGAVAARPVQGLQGLQGALHVAVFARAAGEGPHGGLDFGGLQQGVAFHRVALDVEALALHRGGRGGGRRLRDGILAGCAQPAGANNQHE
jgi:hypothetical protein